MSFCRLGGLLLGTSLDIIVTPVVFHWFGERALATDSKNKNEGDTADELAQLPGIFVNEIAEPPR